MRRNGGEERDRDRETERASSKTLVVSEADKTTKKCKLSCSELRNEFLNSLNV